MEIRTSIKTLETRFFNSSTGVSDNDRFTPAVNEPYTVVQEHFFEGVKLKQGQVIKLTIKNKRNYHYKVL